MSQRAFLRYLLRRLAFALVLVIAVIPLITDDLFQRLPIVNVGLRVFVGVVRGASSYPPCSWRCDERAQTPGGT